MGLRIDDGAFNSADLSGLNVGLLLYIPGLMSRGDYTLAGYIDERASDIHLVPEVSVSEPGPDPSRPCLEPEGVNDHGFKVFRRNPEGVRMTLAHLDRVDDMTRDEALRWAELLPRWLGVDVGIQGKDAKVLGKEGGRAAQ